MRLRKKPWIETALQDYQDLILPPTDEQPAGRWHDIFARHAALEVELGTGKGRFLSELARRNPHKNFIGIDAQQDILYYAALKIRECGLTNVKLLPLDVAHITGIFAPGEIDCLYINFCDPWPKSRHAKRRLTHRNFLEKYRTLLTPGGSLLFKTDNADLFQFSLAEFHQCDLTPRQVAFDLHHPDAPGHAENIMTEYEEKFSRLGAPIKRAEVIFTSAAKPHA